MSVAGIKEKRRVRGLSALVFLGLILLLLATPAYADVIYTVEEGDSAWSIAIRFGVSLDDLYEANGWASDENPVLQIGQRIAIPADRDDDEAATSETDESGEEVSEETTYIVQSGDNPYLIAHRFGIGTLALLEYNGLTEDDLIHPGMLLSIPPGDYEYQGNAESESELEESEPAPEPLRYRVQAGDNPWVIARRFGITVQTLLSYNGLDDSVILHVGDELLVPADAGSLSSRSGSWITYTVAGGDTLSEIAEAHSVSTAALAEANNLVVTSILREGQQLMIPSYRSTAAPAQATSNPLPENPPVPEPPRDLSESLSPLPGLNNGANTPEDIDGWHSEIFDFTQISIPEPSTPDPEEIESGGLSTDGHFDDGTPYHLYTVRRGDTLGEVANAFGITQSELMNRNGLDLRSTLRIGRDLRIPMPRPPAPQPSGGSSGSIQYGAPSVPIGTGSGSELGRQVVEEAMKYMGTPYVWSGSNLTGGVDCSGFTMAVYSLFGVDLPHRARDQAECGVAVDYADLVPGDLVLFHTTRSGISHVGIYIGNGEFIHSSSHRGGVVINPLDTGYYNTRFVCARRVTG